MTRNTLAIALLLGAVPFAALVSASPTPSKPAALPAAASGQASPSASADKITLARPTASLEIMAEPSKVWKKLVSNEGLTAFGLAGDKKKTLDKVGDNVHATVGGDAGNLVVTHIMKDGEWRAAFEPETGNYVRSVRFQLKAEGNGTLIAYSDWYSDEKTETVDKNLKDAERSMTESLARFKGLIEKTSAAGGD